MNGGVMQVTITCMQLDDDLNYTVVTASDLDQDGHFTAKAMDVPDAVVNAALSLLLGNDDAAV